MIIATKLLVGAAVGGLLTASVSFWQGGAGQHRAETMAAVATSSGHSGEVSAPQDAATAVNTQVQNQQPYSRYCPGACDWSMLFRYR